MSVESDLQTLLAGHAPLAALVGTRIAQNATPRGDYPLVVYTTQHAPEHGLDGTKLADQVSVQIQCWAATAEQADLVADAVQGALALAPARAGVTVTGRAGVFDEDIGLDGTQLTVEWWA